MKQILLLKYVNFWQEQQLPKTYDNFKLSFLWF